MFPQYGITKQNYSNKVRPACVHRRKTKLSEQIVQWQLLFSLVNQSVMYWNMIAYGKEKPEGAQNALEIHFLETDMNWKE